MLTIRIIIILIRAQLVSHDSVTSQLQKERDLAQDEVDSMNSVLEQETASLKFQLSTIQMELAQERKVIHWLLGNALYIAIGGVEGAETTPLIVTM